MAIDTVGTERDYMGNLITHYQPNLVVVEACGPSGWISDTSETNIIHAVTTNRRQLRRQPMAR